MSFLSKTNQPRSWGRYPKVTPAEVQSVFWRSELPNIADFEQPVLPYAYGRSYGDSCLNEGGVSLDVSHLRRFISFDEDEGLLCCEAGVSLAEVLELVLEKLLSRTPVEHEEHDVEHESRLLDVDLPVVGLAVDGRLVLLGFVA